jgi:hypothetical protein
MRKLPLRRSSLFFQEEIEFSQAGLVADPDAAPLSSAFHDALDDWEPLFKKERLARRAEVQAQAVVVVCNHRLDTATIRFAALARATAPDVLERCFKMTPAKFVRGNLRKQCEVTKSVIVPEIAKLPADHPLKPFGAQLDALASAAITALDNRATEAGKRQSVSNDVLEWKEGINALRTTTYAELLKISVEKGLPKSWVESFFRQESDDSDDETTAAEPTTTASE